MFKIFLLILLIIFSINGMDQDVTQSSCSESCWAEYRKLPARCENIHLTAGTERCWEKFCKLCGKKFPTGQYYPGESSSSTHQNIQTGWDDDVRNIEAQFGAININREQHEPGHPEALTDAYLATIMENINSNSRGDIQDYNLFMMFNERILKNVLYKCSTYNNNFNNIPWTSFLCEKANRIKRSLDRILIIPNYRYYEELGNLGKQLRFSYIEKNEICNEINEDIYNWMVVDIMNKYIRNINDDLRPKLLKNLNDYMEERVEENIKILNDYTTAKINVEQLRYTTLGNDNIEHIKNYINKEHLKPIGCEITIAASQICLQGDYLNCHRIRPALSFFAIDIFITAIMEDGFDDLVGKWPITFFLGV